MKFGLTGDTHNNIKNIKDICDIFNSVSVDFVIHTGDISLPKSLEIFSSLNCPLHGVFGNNDEGDKADLIEVCKEKNFDFSNGPKVMEKSGVKILIVHDPDDIKESDYYDFDLITHGHTHRFRDEKIENAFVFNPGECAGLMKGKNKIGIVSLHQISMDIIQF